MPSRPLTILFMPESAYGPTNNCIGIGDVLRRRGHRVVFAAEASWKGKLEPLGFEEDLVDLAAPAEGGQDAGQFWKDFVAQTAPEFRKPTIEQLETWIKPVWEELIGGARYCHDQLRAIVERASPDVIVEDNVVGFPALVTARRAVRADRVLQPAGDQGPRRAAHVLRVPGRRPGRMGRVPGRVRPGAPPAVAGLQRLVHGAGRAVPARPGVHRRGRRQPLRLPGTGRLPAGVSRSGRPGTGSTPRCGRPTRSSRCRPRWPAAGR